MEIEREISVEAWEDMTFEGFEGVQGEEEQEVTLENRSVYAKFAKGVGLLPVCPRIVHGDPIEDRKR